MRCLAPKGTLFPESGAEGPDLVVPLGGVRGGNPPGSFGTALRRTGIPDPKPLKKTLVTFALAADFDGEMPNECNLVIDNGAIKGRVTSISVSQYLNRIIGIAFVAPEQSKEGQQFQIRNDSGALITATVVKAPFFHLLNS